MELLDKATYTQQLIDTWERRLRLLEKQQAKLGIHTDPSVIMEIEDLAQTIADLRASSTLPPAPARLDALSDQAAPPAKYRGLVVLVGPGRAGVNPISQAAGAAIRHHLAEPGAAGLQHCWLLPSGVERFENDQAATQRDAVDVARELARDCAAHGVAVHIRPIGDPFSVQATYDMVEWLFAYDVPAAGLAEGDLICDFTGGTKLMSAGMILACGERRAMQSVVFGAGGGSAPLQVRFAPKAGR